MYPINYTTLKGYPNFLQTLIMLGAKGENGVLSQSEYWPSILKPLLFNNNLRASLSVKRQAI